MTNSNPSLFTKQQILDFSKLEEFADCSFKFEENGEKTFKKCRKTL